MQLTHYMLDKFFMFLLSSDSSKNYFRNTIRVSNGLDPDRDQCSVRPDGLQRLSVDGKSHHQQGKS